MAEFGLKILDFGREVCKKDKERHRLIHYVTTIHLIESGKGYFNGMQLGAGQGFLCRTDRISEWYPDTAEPWTYMWISIGGETMESVIELLGYNEDVFSWDSKKMKEELAEVCASDFLKRTMFHELKCISALYEILAESVKGEKNIRKNYVQRAQEAFRANINRNITIEQVAKSLGIYRAYLRNVFFSELGCSPQEYRIKLKMERAQSLLRDEYTITEIAWAVGYNDVLQFSRIFKKYHGVCPTEYRRGLYGKKDK